MRRWTALTLLTAVVAVTLPAVPASACTIAIPQLTVDKDVVPAGGRLAVSGEDRRGPMPPCSMPPVILPTPAATATGTATPTETATPVETGTPSETAVATETATPSETATAAPTGSLAMTNVAYARPLAPGVVTLELVAATSYFAESGPARVVGTARATSAPVAGTEDTLYTFATTVIIPADVRPGSYRLSAADSDGLYGYALIRVVESLPDTGRPSGALAGLGTVLVAAGAGAVVLGRRRGRYAAR